MAYLGKDRDEGGRDEQGRSLSHRLPFYYGWVIVGAAIAGSFAAVPLTPIIFSLFIGPMTDDLGWGRSAITWGYTIRLAASAAMAPFLGMFLDRLGARWLGVAAGILAGGSVMALAGVHSLWLMYLLFAIAGTTGLGGGAGTQMLTQVPVAKWFVARRGRAMAIGIAGFALAVVIAIPAFQWLIDSFGWRAAWAVAGIMTMALMVPAYGLFMRRSPEDLGLRPDGGPSVGTVAHQRKAGPAPGPARDWSAREALRTPAMWLIVVAFGLLGAGVSGTVVLRVSYYQDLGVSPALIALGTALDPVTVGSSVLVFGWIGERVHPRFIGVAGAAGNCLAMLPLIFLSSSPYLVLAHGVLVGVSVAAYITCVGLIWPAYFGRRFLGTIAGIATPVTLLGAGFGAPLYGFLFDSGMKGRSVWMVSAGVFAGAVIALAFARKPSHPRPGMAQAP